MAFYETNPKSMNAIRCPPNTVCQNKANLNIFLIFRKAEIMKQYPFNAIALHLGLFGIDNPCDNRYNLV
jgi:hypothetical protein